MRTPILTLTLLLPILLVGCAKEKHVGYITEYAIGSVETPYIKAVLNGEEYYFEITEETSHISVSNK